MAIQRCMSNLVFIVVNIILLSAGAEEILNDDGLSSLLNARNLNTVATINDAGFVAETHNVITSDGYILEMQRIPFGRGQTSTSEPRPPVFMMHGLLAASQSYVSSGPELSAAHVIADGGFDVWLGNARGNRYSRKHLTLNPSDREDKFSFFNFTWEEIAIYDVSAMIDYVLKHTGREKLHYIGHSQGGTVFLVLNSLMPEYNAKIASAHLLAGVGYQRYFPNRLLSIAAARADTIYNLAVRLGVVEIVPPLSDLLPIPIDWNSYDCTGMGHRELCDLMGLRELMRNNSSTGLRLGGASIKQIAHYGQNIEDKLFRRWDYGFSGNLALYGSSTPPEYDLSLITVNVTMHYTVNDRLLDERDVLAMAAVMPNAVVRRVARDSFTHTDFAIAPDAKELVTDYIVESLIRDENAANEGESEEVDYGPEDVMNSAHVLTVGRLYLLCTILSLTWILL